jgi:peptidoglycan/xylan/chitin deacetylase (PgdA/CDA1 family)
VVTFDDGVAEVYTWAFPILQRYRIPATLYLATRYVEEQRFFGFRGYQTGARPLNWAQVREMMASGLITVGAHTHSHADLTRLPAEAVEEELERSLDLIEARTGVRAMHFAYPWGAVTAQVRRAVAARFRTAVRGGAGKNLPPVLDPLALWRQPVQQSDGFWLFRLKLESYLDGEEALRRLGHHLRIRAVPGRREAR